MEGVGGRGSCDGGAVIRFMRGDTVVTLINGILILLVVLFCDIN